MYFVPLIGDRYQIGFQHGRRLRTLIHYAVRRRCRSYRKQRPDTLSLQKQAREIEVAFPKLMEEMSGIAHGSNIPLDDILLYNLSPVPSACSNVVFVGDDGPMLGHVNDDAEGTFDVAFYVRPDDGLEFLHVGDAGGVGTSAAVNSGGLAMSHAAARGTAERCDSCLNLRLLRRLLAEQSSSCEEARLFLSKHSYWSGADNIICADRHGYALVAEKLPRLVAFRDPQGSGIYCTGRPLTAEIRNAMNQDAYEAAEPPEMARLIGREKHFASVLARPKTELSFTLMERALQNTDDGVEVCNEFSTWAAILLPSSFEMWIAGIVPDQDTFKRVGRGNRLRVI